MQRWPEVARGGQSRAPTPTCLFACRRSGVVRVVVREGLAVPPVAKGELRGLHRRTTPGLLLCSRFALKLFLLEAAPDECEGLRRVQACDPFSELRLEIILLRFEARLAVQDILELLHGPCAAVELPGHGVFLGQLLRVPFSRFPLGL